MRSRVVHFAALLLLLSSVAMSDARAGGLERSPGGVFVRNLLLQAAIDEAQPAASDFASEETPVFTVVSVRAPRIAMVAGPAAQTAHVHAVTGSSL